jgi:four helix bundle protein
LQIAAGSASELDYHLLLAKDLKFLTEEQYSGLEKSLGEVRRMLSALVQKVNTERMLAKMLSANC